MGNWLDRNGVERHWDKLMHKLGLDAPLMTQPTIIGEAGPITDEQWQHISNRVPLDPDAD